MQIFPILISIFFSIVKVVHMGVLTGEMTGEMTGGVKTIKVLYIKGIQIFNGRDEPIFFTQSSFFGGHAALSDPSHPLSDFIPSVGTKYSQVGNKAFPAWE
jgi:hypothetical protein